MQDLSENDLSGHIPKELGQLSGTRDTQHLEILIAVVVAAAAASFLCTCAVSPPGVVYLVLGHNNLTGPIPEVTPPPPNVAP
jgi:hypothetical protein